MYNSLKKRVKRFAKGLLAVEEKSISVQLQRLAGMETARYVQSRMNKVKAFSSQEEIMRYAVESIEKNRGGGGESLIIAEFGVFEGKSINYIASLVGNGQKIYGFDCFDGLPLDWRTDFERGTFKVDGLPKVAENVTLIKGLFSDTLPRFVAEHQAERCALLHIDCDLYESTRDVLTNLSGQIGAGTVLVFDEYFNYPGWQEGEYKAFQEFVSEQHLRYEYLAYNALHEQVAVRIL